MSPPTERFSQLSLDKMPPTTRLQSRGQQQEDEEELRSDLGMESEFEDDDPSAVIVSPSKLTYSLNDLDEETRDSVIDTFSDPPQMTLKAYASRGQYVVFQVAESLPCWIQAGAEDSQYSVPTCGCDAQERPCRHLIWLFDQLSSQMLTNEGQTLTMTRDGYAAELGNPFVRISDFHIDMLADSLHCNPSSGPSPRRVQETREILASLNETPLDEYRPDLVSDSGGGNDDDDDKEEDEDAIITRRDLEKTIFRMLLRNDDFFSYFLASMPADELVNNRFRQLEQRAATALAGLDAYAAEDPAAAAAAAAARGSRPKDVEWCAAHLALVLDQIAATIQHARMPLTAHEQRAAARAVVRTLEGVVERAGRNAAGGGGAAADAATLLPLPLPLPRAQRDLYFCLVGDRDRDFAVRVLNQLAPAALVPWVGRLGAIEDRILAHGAPPSYVKKLRSLLARVRSSASSSSSSATAAAGTKRGSQGHDRSRAKRMK